MKVLKPGKKPEDTVYQTTCQHCKALLEYKRSEATFISDQKDGDYLEVTCPECGQSVSQSVFQSVSGVFQR